MSDAVSIRSCASREETRFLKSALEVNGINAKVLADRFAGSSLQIFGGVKLIVLQKDAERAREVINRDQDD
jgi:hypothetical protein